MPTGAASAGAADTPRRYANRIPIWTSDLRGHYYGCNWTILVVMLVTTATLSSNSSKSTIVFFIHFTPVLRKQFGAVDDTFLREANSYKRALALRNSRQLSNSALQIQPTLSLTWSSSRDSVDLHPANPRSTPTGGRKGIWPKLLPRTSISLICLGRHSLWR